MRNLMLVLQFTSNLFDKKASCSSSKPGRISSAIGGKYTSTEREVGMEFFPPPFGEWD